MTDPTPGDVPTPDALSDVERESRIEQLLVSGLDDYFAGRLDQAVNVWTRVLFLDRSSDRARAYIDRARRAQAERQRETEALMHQGLQAFDDGNVETARRLLTAAVERGAPHEQTLPVLHRIGLLEPVPLGAVRQPRRPRWRRSATDAPEQGGERRLWPWAVALGILAVAGAAVLSLPAARQTAAAPVTDVEETPLPVPAASETHLRRARALFATGRLPDALAALDRIARGDALYEDAQALRLRVQRELLASAAVDPAGTAERDRP